MDGTEDTLQDPVDALFEQARRAGEATLGLSHDCLNHYRRDCRAALDWQRTEGSVLVTCGEDPERVLELTEEWIGEARGRLHERLTNLLAWSANRPPAPLDPG